MRATVDVIEICHAFSSEFKVLTLVFANWNMGCSAHYRKLAKFRSPISIIRDFQVSSGSNGVRDMAKLKQKQKTYNSRYSLVVTHPTTNLPI